MSSPVTQIEQAIIEQLRAVPRAYKPLIESYAAQLDDEMFDWIRTLPACWVTFGQVGSVQRKGVHSYLHSGTFEVLSAQRALGENAGRMAGVDKGDSVGVYEMLEHNKLALVNRKLGLPIDPLVPGAIRPVMKGMRTRVELRFPRDKLSAKTPDRVRSELLDVAYKLEELEIIENVDLWKNDLVCERDSQDNNRLNAKIPVDVVNGLHVFAGRMDLIL